MVDTSMKKVVLTQVVMSQFCMWKEIEKYFKTYLYEKKDFSWDVRCEMWVQTCRANNGWSYHCCCFEENYKILETKTF